VRQTAKGLSVVPFYMWQFETEMADRDSPWPQLILISVSDFLNKT
jgi:hypothetical protein